MKNDDLPYLFLVGKTTFINQIVPREKQLILILRLEDMNIKVGGERAGF